MSARTARRSPSFAAVTNALSVAASTGSSVTSDRIKMPTSRKDRCVIEIRPSSLTGYYTRREGDRQWAAWVISGPRRDLWAGFSNAADDGHIEAVCPAGADEHPCGRHPLPGKTIQL